MTHAYHEGLTGYNASQILHDGCGECEERAKRDDHGIGNLDRLNFTRAWGRAAEWGQSPLSNLSRAEMPLLNTLWAVQLKLEQFGVPIGTLPVGIP